MATYQDVLVVLDPSTEQQKALDRAIELAEHTACKLTAFLSIYDFSYEMTTMLSGEERESMRQAVITDREIWIQELLQQARSEGKVAIVIRNQPHGSVAIRQIIPFDRIISTLSPDGKVVSAPDPNQKTFSTFDGRFVLEGQGRRTAGGVVFGNQTIKIGAPVELEGTNYRFNGTVTGLKLGTS